MVALKQHRPDRSKILAQIASVKNLNGAEVAGIWRWFVTLKPCCKKVQLPICVKVLEMNHRPLLVNSHSCMNVSACNGLFLLISAQLPASGFASLRSSLANMQRWCHMWRPRFTTFFVQGTRKAYTRNGFVNEYFDLLATIIPKDALDRAMR